MSSEGTGFCLDAKRWAVVCSMPLFLLAMLGCQLRYTRFSAIYLDLDGTALDSSATVRGSTVAALREFQRAGGRVGVATGRTWEQAAGAVALLHPDLPVVLANGAVIVDPRTGREIVRHYMSAEVARRAVAFASQRDSVLGCVVHFERANVADRPVALADFVRGAGLTLAREPLGLVDTTTFGHVVKVLVVVMALPDAGGRPCGCVSAGTRTLADRVRDELAAAATPAIVVVSGSQTVEVVPFTKGAAVMQALRASGIRASDVIACGDSGNDMEMLRMVGLGAAMGNCRSGACEAALVRIGDNDSDAIAELVRRVALKARPQPSDAVP